MQCRVVRATAPAECGVLQPEQSAVIEHRPARVADQRVEPAMHRQLGDIPRQTVLQQLQRVRPDNVELAQTRHVLQRRGLLARPVFLDRAGGIKLRRHPKIARHVIGCCQLRGAGMKGGMLGHLGGIFRVGPPRDGMGDCAGFFINSDVNIGGVPAIDRVQIIGTGGRDRDQIGQRLHRHIVARTGPCLVDRDVVVVPVDPGVEEEIDRRPRTAALNAERRKRLTDIVRAVDVTGKAALLVAPRRAGQRERVVTPDRVLPDRQQRPDVLIEELVMQARQGIGAAGHGA